ncbi:MAG TPA: hypothetical protein HPP97_11365 [Desulfuromonadales bacterium]|nr:hypothetical protein [Desulfuromonadales bacterium]
MTRHKTDSSTEILTTVAGASPEIGQLAGTNSQGDILVTYNALGATPAKLVAGLDRKTLGDHDQQGREVLLLFEQGDPQRPIIIALMENRLESLIYFGDDEKVKGRPAEAVIDGKRVTIEGEQEVILKCGKGSIEIRSDGRIIVKGTDILSRSSGRQRIRGASVNIN